MCVSTMGSLSLFRKTVKDHYKLQVRSWFFGFSLISRNKGKQCLFVYFNYLYGKPFWEPRISDVDHQYQYSLVVLSIISPFAYSVTMTLVSVPISLLSVSSSGVYAGCLPSPQHERPFFAIVRTAIQAQVKWLVASSGLTQRRIDNGHGQYAIGYGYILCYIYTY